MIQWYVGFYDPAPTSFWARFGHVEVWGYTKDDTWVFMDPRSDMLRIEVTHLHDEVEAHLAHRYANCGEIWRLSDRGKLRIPVIAPFFCIPFVGHVLGLRAFTFSGLRRQLRRNGAECIYENPERRSRRKGSTRTRTEDRGEGKGEVHPGERGIPNV